MTKYNLEYKGVTCTAADWEAEPHKFVLIHKGCPYLYEQKRYISQSADTDHIRCVIEQFLEDVEDVERGSWIVTDADDGMCENYAGFIEFKCSKCGYSYGIENGQYGWYYGDPIPWKACPMCGARMDGESSENEQAAIWGGKYGSSKKRCFG